MKLNSLFAILTFLLAFPVSLKATVVGEECNQYAQPLTATASVVIMGLIRDGSPQGSRVPVVIYPDQSIEIAPIDDCWNISGTGNYTIVADGYSITGAFKVLTWPGFTPLNSAQGEANVPASQAKQDNIATQFYNQKAEACFDDYITNNPDWNKTYAAIWVDIADGGPNSVPAPPGTNNGITLKNELPK